MASMVEFDTGEPLGRLRDAPILQDPFPHMYIEDFLPRPFYRRLLDALPAAGQFTKMVYPGVGRGVAALEARGSKEQAPAHGLALDLAARPAPVTAMVDFFAGDAFRDTLLTRFSATDSWKGEGPAIPAFKHGCFTNGAHDVTTVFDVHKDLPGFELAPHRDVDEKVLTFLFYMEPDDLLADWGTLLCRPRNGLTCADVEAAPGLPGYPNSRAWDLFVVAKTARALPNNLLVFAPNKASYHAVRFDVPDDFPRRERTVLRGFVRQGRDRKNFIRPATAG